MHFSVVYRNQYAEKEKKHDSQLPSTTAIMSHIYLKYMVNMILGSHHDSVMIFFTQFKFVLQGTVLHYTKLMIFIGIYAK